MSATERNPKGNITDIRNEYISEKMRVIDGEAGLFEESRILIYVGSLPNASSRPHFDFSLQKMLNQKLQTGLLML
jgi:hypothetical protein